MNINGENKTQRYIKPWKKSPEALNESLPFDRYWISIFE